MTAEQVIIEDDVENQQFLSLSEYRPQQNGTTNKMSSKQQEKDVNDVLSSSTALGSGSISHAHPKAAFFTIFFKSLAIGTYVFGSWFTSNFILIFVFVILCLACDFWTVKNVTGRLLVGLRWWNQVKEDGTSEWKFESKNTLNMNPMNDNNNNDKSQNKDSRLFWTALYLTPCLWILLCIACIVKFNIKWLPLTLVGIALNFAQLWGYWKCRREANAQNNNNNNNENSSSYIPSFTKSFTKNLFTTQNIQNAIGSQIANQFNN